MNYEEKLLVELVKAYRSSKKDTGDNLNNRRTKIKPEKLYNKYHSNDGDFEKISSINNIVDFLSEKGYIIAKTERFGTGLTEIYLVDAKIMEIEQYISQKYGYVSKDKKIEILEDLISKYYNASEICMKECEDLSKKLEKRIIPGNITELEDVFKAIAFIENNKEELYIREVSMKVYGDSKYFENTIMDQVCSILKKYNNNSNFTDMLNDEVLTIYNIFKEPQTLSMKGNAIIRIQGIDVDISGFSDGVVFRATELINIECIKIMASSFMTIENHTSYLRYKDDDTVVFYLGGYANRYQRDFIKLIYEHNPTAEYLHFGDIDAGGFWIHNNLCEITGVEFGLFCMSIKELTNSLYQSCLHTLTDNDVSRMMKLLENQKYNDVIKYMLDNNVKLEQEIVSLDLMDKSNLACLV